jgi:hypothetical protein
MPDALPDLAVGLIRVRDAGQRSAAQAAGIVPYVAELTAIIHNLGEALAEKPPPGSGYRFDIDRELRLVYTPAVPPHDRSRSRRCGTPASVTAST